MLVTNSDNIDTDGDGGDELNRLFFALYKYI